MAWETIERPGHFGKKRDEILKHYDERFGKDGWRIMWQWGDGLIPYTEACMVYEEAYHHDSFKREPLWKELVRTAMEVYDHSPSDIESGTDYTLQAGNATHLQDIAIRRVLMRRGWEFQGDELVQIRSHSEYWGQNLSPGKLPFHMPEMIVVPHLEGWWNAGSVEDFYQSNKVLQARPSEK